METEEKQAPKLRLSRTCSIFVMFFSLGFYEALVGPAFLDMIMLYKTDTKTMGVVFLLNAVSYLVGSVVCGLVIDRFNQELIVALFGFVAAATLVGTPWIPQVMLFIFMFGILKGISGGMVDTAGQSYLNGLWAGTRWHDPLMQGLHFTWSVSTTVTPLIIQPFLAERLPDQLAGQPPEKDGNITNHSNSSATTPGSIEDASADTQVQIGFVVLGCLIFVCSLFPFTVFLIAKPTIKALPFSKTTEIAKQNEDRGFKVRMLVLIFMYYLLYSGMEMVFSGLLATFAVKSLQWDKYKGPLITSVYWGLFGFARLVSVPVSMFCHPRTMTFAGLLVIATSLLTMIFAAHFHEAIMWIATAVFGFAMGPLYPACVVWVSKYIVVTGPASAIILIGSSTAGVVFPALVAFLFDSGKYEWMLYIKIGLCFLALVLFMFMNIYAVRHGEIKHTETKTQDAKENMLEPSVDVAVSNGEKSHQVRQDVTML